jgi:hypothetical protein
VIYYDTTVYDETEPELGAKMQEADALSEIAMLNEYAILFCTSLEQFI